jgi:hypothetical protein
VNPFCRLCLLLVLLVLAPVCPAADRVEVDTLAGLYEAAAGNANAVRVKPGTYALGDYLTDEKLAELKRRYPREGRRPSRWLLRFSGSDNTFDFTGVTIEIDTALYAKLPFGYTRCILVDGDNNTLRGLKIRNTGSPELGSHGNTLSIFGRGNTLEDVQVHVSGSSPYGYGDLLGKGAKSLVRLRKQSGVLLSGEDHRLRRCKVFSRAFGHCFYIQSLGGVTRDILLEDCYAEGVTRTTNEMLAETDGPAFDVGFRSVNRNRDGRFIITAGYTKSLSEDGYRTYAGVGRVTFRNCTAVNTRAGFEVRNTREDEPQTVIEGCVSLGAERAYLIGSNVRVRDSRGDVVHGPLLYLRQGSKDADVELELIGGLPKTTVHALATIAGEDHRVRIFTEDPHRPLAALPIMFGFGIPSNAEMASEIGPARTVGVTLVNDVARLPVILSEDAEDCVTDSAGPVVDDEKTRRSRR